MKTQPTYILGDHHSDHDDLIRALIRRGLRNCRLIHVGDGEEGYCEKWNDDTPAHLDQAFGKIGIEYMSIRGNHCNPHIFDGSVDFPKFKLIKDYTKLEIEGEVWLMVGGAVSIDRVNRIPGETWWVEEEMTLDESKAHAADVLVTHTGPSRTTPRNTAIVDHYARIEASLGTKTLKKELRDEAERHDRLYKIVKPKIWYHGHHHISATHQVGPCTIRQLAMAELVKHQPVK